MSESKSTRAHIPFNSGRASKSKGHLKVEIGGDESGTESERRAGNTAAKLTYESMIIALWDFRLSLLWFL